MASQEPKFRQRNAITAIDKIPTESGVYFLFHRGILVYIGKAQNLQTRVQQHLRTKVFDEVEYEPAHWNRSRKLEQVLLGDYLKQHKQYPYYNRQG